MHLGMIDQHATVAVRDDRARLPRVPQRAHHLHVFIGHVVAQVMLRHPLHAEIHRREFGTSGDGVPADAALRDLVQRRHESCQQIRRIGIGAEGGDDADAGGDRGHQRGHHRRVLPRHGNAVLQIDFRGPVIALADIRAVFEQDVVEARTLQATRHVEEQLGDHPGGADMARPWLAPRLHAGALQEPTEVKRACGHGCHAPAPDGVRPVRRMQRLPGVRLQASYAEKQAACRVRARVRSR